MACTTVCEWSLSVTTRVTFCGEGSLVAADAARVTLAVICNSAARREVTRWLTARMWPSVGEAAVSPNSSRVNGRSPAAWRVTLIACAFSHAGRMCPRRMGGAGSARRGRCAGRCCVTISSSAVMTSSLLAVARVGGVTVAVAVRATLHELQDRAIDASIDFLGALDGLHG